MEQASIFDTKTNLSRYVSDIAEGRTSELVILKNNKPVAKIVPYIPETNKRLGLGRGIIPEMPDLEAFNAIDIAEDFYEGGLL